MNGFSFFLNIKIKKISELNTTYFQVNKNYSLHCDNQIKHVTWHKLESEHIVITREPNIIFVKVGVEDTGGYVCKGINKNGHTARAVTNVIVVGMKLKIKILLTVFSCQNLVVRKLINLIKRIRYVFWP